MNTIEITREDYIHTDAVKIERDGVDAVAYKYNSGGRACATVFYGSRVKPDIHYNYATVEERDADIERYFRDAALQAKIAEGAKWARRRQLQEFVGNLSDEDLSILLDIAKDRLTVWAPRTDNDSSRKKFFPAKLLGTYAHHASSDRSVSLLLEDEDDG